MESSLLAVEGERERERRKALLAWLTMECYMLGPVVGTFIKRMQKAAGTVFQIHVYQLPGLKSSP